MRAMGALLALVGATAITAGCGAAPPAEAHPPSSSGAAWATPSTQATPRPRCDTPSTSALAAVDASVRAAGDGNRLPEAVVLAEPDSGAWLLAGAFAGPAAQGEGALGIWATFTDPTVEPFTGRVYAVDGGAVFWSTAPVTTEVGYDPENVPVLGCWGRR